MKYLLSLFILTAFCSFAGKTYTYNLTVHSLFEHSPIQGIQVTITEKYGEVFHLTTNKLGMISVELTKHVFSLELVDSTGNHRTYFREDFFYKSKSDTEEIYLRLSEDLEAKLIESKKAPDGTEIDLDEMTFHCPKLETAWAATYNGGFNKLLLFISEHKIYPQVCIDNNIRGTVNLICKIDEQGELSEITVLKSLCPEADDEAIRIVSYLPNFKPATCNGEAISSYIKIPVWFGIF